MTEEKVPSSLLFDKLKGDIVQLEQKYGENSLPIIHDVLALINTYELNLRKNTEYKFEEQKKNEQEIYVIYKI